MSTTPDEAVRIPIVSCSECWEAFDVCDWDQLRMIEKREPIGTREGAEVRECCGCSAPVVVPCGLLADAREGYMTSTRQQYDQLFPENGRPTVDRPSFWRRAWKQLTGA